MKFLLKLRSEASAYRRLGLLYRDCFGEHKDVFNNCNSFNSFTSMVRNRNFARGTSWLSDHFRQELLLLILLRTDLSSLRLLTWGSAAARRWCPGWTRSPGSPLKRKFHLTNQINKKTLYYSPPDLPPSNLPCPVGKAVSASEAGSPPSKTGPTASPETHTEAVGEPATKRRNTCRN